MGRHEHFDDGDQDSPLFRQIEALIGADQAAVISAKFGGRRIYIPAKCGAHHPLAFCVGLENALKICAAIGRNPVEVPLAAGKRLRIAQLLKRGVKPDAIAAQLGCGRRWVFYIQAEQRAGGETPPDEQLKLL